MGGALEARGIPAGDDRLTSQVEGDIHKEDGVLVIKRIRVAYRLELEDADKEEEAWRAHRVHPPRCPVYKTLENSVEMTTTMEIVTS